MSQAAAVEEFLGVEFSTDALDGAARSILAERPDRFRYVVTPNVQHMVKILEDPEATAPIYRSAWRVYCDSRVLSRLARLMGKRLPVVTGSDQTAEILQQANATGLKVAIIGPSAADCAELRTRYPRLDIVCHTPSQGFIAREQEVAACVDFVRSEGAPLLFLAVGMPRQEILASRLAATDGVRGIGLCVGASIDFLTGRQRRAPRWVQRAGLEWLHRLLSDPVRLGSRYLVECPRIFVLALRELRKSAQAASR